MTLVEKYLINKSFDVLVTVKNDLTQQDICKCYYDQCHTVTDNLTGHTGIKDKSGAFYMTYERLRDSDNVYLNTNVYFNVNNQLLEVTFKV